MSTERPSFVDQVSIYPRNLTELSREELNNAQTRVTIQRRRAGSDDLRVERVHPKIWNIALNLCEGHPGRIQIVSETEVIVHNNGNWRRHG